MTENLMKFMAAVSTDKTLSAKISNESDKNVIIAIAKEMGFELTAADFEKEPAELSDDELDSVAGGTAVTCSCALGGGGAGDDNDKTCACVALGLGFCDDGDERCFCPIAGMGYGY